jgi:uncharacterized repeat protein (TIGR01451 family)
MIADPSKELKMKNENARPNPVRYRYVFILVSILAAASAMIALPVYSARVGLSLDRPTGSVVTGGMTRQLNRKSFSLLHLSMTESIATYAQDCTTPRTTFFLGETVCAAVSGVTESDRFVNWLSPPDSHIAFTSPVISDSSTHFFQFTPTIAGGWKATIADPTDSSIIPAVFTVTNSSPPVATYAAGCTTPQSDFVLGDVVCVKATGSVSHRVLFLDPVSMTEDSADVASDPQTINFTLPTATSLTKNAGTRDEVTFDTRGTWRVELQEPVDGVGLYSTSITVRDPNPATKVADLQVNKTYSVANGANANDTLQAEVWVYNYGPDAAANVVVDDSTPSNTTFQSLSQNSGPTFTCTTPSVGSAGTAHCTISELKAGEAGGFLIAYKVNSSIGNGTALDSTTTASTTTTERSTTDDSATASGTGSNPTPPSCTLSCPGNVTVTADTTDPDNLDSQGHPVPAAHVTLPDATASGSSCGTVSSSIPSGSLFDLGSTPVTYTAADGTTCDFLVIVVSSGSAVTISCPAAVSANAGPNCNATVSLGTPTTTGDNVTVTGTRSDGQPLNSPFPTGVTTVHWVASNSSGSDSCDQQVTVNDVTPPTITAVSQTVSADSSCQAVIPDYHNSANDNCACASDDNSEICQTRDDIVVTQDVAAGTSVGLGTTTIHLTATDEANNTSTKTITFTVVDTTAPTFTFVPAAITAYTGAGATTCDTTVDPGTATASDNCGPITITRSPSGNTFPVGTTTITWTAKDGANNTTTATQTVTVIDNTPPVITLNGNTPSMWPPNHDYQTFQVTNFVASVFDNCGGVSVSDVVIEKATSDEAEDADADGSTLNDIVIAPDYKSIQLRSERSGTGNGRVYTITFRLTDTHGNVTRATAKVVVAHNTGETPVDSGVHYTVNGAP